jgi:dTDP-4-dehydrorhamnose 3,5-epimerase
MIFAETSLSGAYIVKPEPFEDERGFFALTWSQQEFVARGLDGQLVECNVSFSKKRGTLRGMHFQAPPNGQIKIVRCTMGEIHDVIIDLRPDSPTLKQWLAVKLSAQNRNMLYIPKDFAHGFQTLVDNTEVFYQMSAQYSPRSARGVRWNDPAFGIEWPLQVQVINARDDSYEDYRIPERGAR